jgi:hypothetical protein
MGERIRCMNESKCALRLMCGCGFIRTKELGSPEPGEWLYDGNGAARFGWS